MNIKNRYNTQDHYDDLTDGQINALVARKWGWEVHSKYDEAGQKIWELSLDGVVSHTKPDFEFAYLMKPHIDILEEMIWEMNGFPACNPAVALKLWEGNKQFMLRYKNHQWEAILKGKVSFIAVAVGRDKKPSRAITICWLRWQDTRQK